MRNEKDIHSPERAERDVALSVRADFSCDAPSPLPDPNSPPLALFGSQKKTGSGAGERGGRMDAGGNNSQLVMIP